WMLQREPARRPIDAGMVSEELLRLSDEATPRSAVHAGHPSALTGAEQRLVAVIVASTKSRENDTEAMDSVSLEEATRDERTGHWDGTSFAPLEAELRGALTGYQARLDFLVDGTAVAVFTGARSATDLVAQAARCALAMRKVLPSTP